MPRSAAALQASSKATCTGVTVMSVRFSESWAMPYSSMYQPMPFTAFKRPGILTGSPLASVTILPVTGSPSRLMRPASRMSKAMALARRVLVLFRFTL